MKDIVGTCMQQTSYLQIQEQLYYHYNPDLRIYKSFEEVHRDVRFVASAVTNLLYNKNLVPQIRQSISGEIVEKLKPVLDDLKSPSGDETIVLNEELGIKIPGNVNDFFNALIFDTKQAVAEYKSIIDLDTSFLDDQTISPE